MAGFMDADPARTFRAEVSRHRGRKIMGHGHSPKIADTGGTFLHPDGIRNASGLEWLSVQNSDSTDDGGST